MWFDGRDHQKKKRPSDSNAPEDAAKLQWLHPESKKDCQRGDPSQKRTERKIGYRIRGEIDPAKRLSPKHSSVKRQKANHTSLEQIDASND